MLAELEVQDKPTIHVLNKIDLLSSEERESLPSDENVVQVSAIRGEGLEILLERIDAILNADPVSKMQVSVPQSEGKLLALIEARGTILNREYKSDRVELTVQGPESLLGRVEQFRVAGKPNSPRRHGENNSRKRE